MHRFKSLCKSIGKSLLWLVLSALFGLLQMWIILINNFFDINSSTIIDKIISQGFLVFFCSGITISIAIDFHLASDKDKNKSSAQILYTLYPIIIFTLVTFLGTKFEVSESGSINLNSAKLVQNAILIMTILYALLIKAKDYFVYFVMKTSKV